jgi:hypothetical protein
MAFDQLRTALLKREGSCKESDGSVSFTAEGRKLNFSGTGEFKEGYEYVSVKLNGQDVGLTAYLSKANPRLRTGENLISNRGSRTRCIDVCEKIIENFRSCTGAFSPSGDRRADPFSADEPPFTAAPTPNAQTVKGKLPGTKPWWRFW